MQGSPEFPGIIPRAVESVLKFAKSKEPKQKSKNASPACSISVSYLEIYNEKVYDLLAPKDQDLPIREDQSRNIFIPNLEEVGISGVDDFQKTYAAGCRNRTTASTKLNAKSSRSHAILIMRVQYKETQPPHRTFVGKLHLIDLAGSEDNRRTDNKGIRLTESSNINQSLFVLGKVVHALNKGLVTLFSPLLNNLLCRTEFHIEIVN
jgi:kinesin family protein 22